MCKIFKGPIKVAKCLNHQMETQLEVKGKNDKELYELEL